MEPLPETADAVDEYGPFTGNEHDLVDELRELSEEVRAVAPECVGLSLSLRDPEVTFTLVSSNRDISLLDAMQYLEEGPCLRAMDRQEVITCDADATTEAGWQLFAAATAARGIASTLSLPVVADGRTVGGYNLYASTSDAFDGRHQAIARILGAWAGGAITNSDLGFHTRELARRAPTILRESAHLTIAVGLLAASRGITAEEADARLRRSAVAAGIPLPQLVDAVIGVLRRL